MSKPILWSGAVLSLILAVSAPAAAGDGDGAVRPVDLSTLADGETRTFGHGAHAITATRTGESITIEIPGAEGRDARSLTCRLGERSCYAFATGDGAGVKMVVVGDGPGGEKTKNIEVIRIGEGGDTGDVLVWSADESAPLIPGDAAVRLIALDGAGQALRCPEGDVTMKVEEGDEGETYLCPKHNLPLEKTEAKNLVRKVLIRTAVEEE